MLASVKTVKRVKIKKSIPRAIVFSIMFILFSAYSLTILYAFGWGIISALKTHDEFVYHMFSLPQDWIFKNFIDAFFKLKVGKTNMIGMTFNSLWYTIGGTVLSVGCATTLSYVVCKYKFFGRRVIYTISVIILILPIVGALPAQFKMVKLLNLDESPLILLTFCNGFGFNFIVLYGFFQALSWTYAEASFVDGASDFRTFFTVMLPQALPAIFSLLVLASIGIWNDLQGPLLFLKTMPTLSVGLFEFNQNMKYEADYPILFAGLMISVIPILILFITCQETIMSSTVAGGLKG